MSDSSSWRYSLSASTTPARNVPSAGDSPTACISKVMPMTRTRAAAVKISRSRVWARMRKNGRTMKRPDSTIAPTAAKTSKACCQPGRPPARAACSTPGIASSGNKASIGMTAMSWNSSTENVACPPSDRSSPRSFRLCSTMAVDDPASTSPMASDARQVCPSSMASAAMAAAVSTTCKPPSPRMGRRRLHSRLGFSSSPTRNNIMTTPNSAKCMTSWPSCPINPSRNGPSATPASR